MSYLSAQRSYALSGRFRGRGMLVWFLHVHAALWGCFKCAIECIYHDALCHSILCQYFGYLGDFKAINYLYWYVVIKRKIVVEIQLS